MSSTLHKDSKYFQYVAVTPEPHQTAMYTRQTNLQEELDNVYEADIAANMASGHSIDVMCLRKRVMAN